MSDPLVELDGVDFSYGPERPVLRGCSLRLEPGQRVGLVGANGSGKTTLLHLIVGLVRPSAGRVAVPAKITSSIFWLRTAFGA